MRAVTIDGETDGEQQAAGKRGERDILQAVGGLLGQRSATDGDALLSAQELGLVIAIQFVEVEGAQVVILNGRADAGRSSAALQLRLILARESSVSWHLPFAVPSRDLAACPQL